MGVRGFELLVPDGIGKRMAVVLQGPAGDEMDLFSYQFLAEGLREKEGVLVVLSRISPEEFREQMKANGIDCLTHEKEGSLVIVDWYSYKMGRVDGVEIDGSVLRSSKSLLNLEIALTDGMKKLSGYKNKRAVLDILSPALKMFGSDEVYSLAQKIRTKLKDGKIASLFILEKGVHPEDIVQSIHQTFDGVIDVTRETKEGVVERQVGLLFIRGISYEPNYVDLEFEEGEIVLREPASAEKKRVLKMLKKQEELLEKDPENERIWFSRGNLFTEIDEFELALESFDKVIELNPNHVGAWSGKADALLQLERRDEATEAYQKSLMLSAEKVDEEYFERLKPEEKPEVETRICPLCGSQALLTDTVCPECGTDFKKLEEIPREEGVLGYLEEMKEDMGVTEDELEDILEKKEEAKGAAEPRVERPGLTNGLARKAAKGLVNGLGRVNGLVNGLASARSGLTNGLTNGSGFTNGLASGRFVRESKRNRWKIFIVPLLALVLLSTAFFTPEGPQARAFGIDGYFDDWDDDSIVYSRSTVTNPNIDINVTAVEAGKSNEYIFLLAQVRPGGEALAGNAQDKLGDFLRVFIDSDANAATGYAVAGTGADYLVQVVGRDEGQGPVARHTAVYRYVGGDQTNWNAWEYEACALVALGSDEEANKIEVAISKSLFPDMDSTLFVFQMEDWRGSVDFADYRMSGSKGIVRVRQESADVEIVQTQISGTLLTLELKKIGYKDDGGGALTLDSLTGRLVGTLSPSEIQSMSLAVSNGASGPWQGSLIGADVVTFQPIGYTFGPGSTTDFYVNVLLKDTATPGSTIGFRIESPNDISLSSGAATLESVPTDHDLSYVNFVPAGHVIDAGFSDWTDVMSDGANEPSTGGYSSVDIREYGLNSTMDDSYFYLKVGGQMMEGTLTPQKGKYLPDIVPGQPDSDRDTIPDSEDDYPFDFDNDGTPDALEGGDLDSDGVIDYPVGTDMWLETIVNGNDVRIYIGPRVLPPEVKGEDLVRIYLDSDNNSLTGYFIGDTGADYLIEIAGKNGKLLKGQGVLLEHSGGSGSWHWDPVNGVDVALDFQNMEASIDTSGLGFVEDFPAYFEITGWEQRSDTASGTRSITRTKGEYGAQYEGHYEAYVKGVGESIETISLSYEGNDLSWGLPSSLRLVSDSSKAILSTLNSPSLQVGGNEAIFADSFQNMESGVTYTFEENRIKETIIFKDPLLPAEASWDGYIELESVMSHSDWLTPVSLDPQGVHDPSISSFEAYSGIGFSNGRDIVFAIEPPFVIDSGGDRLDCKYYFDDAGSFKHLSMQCPAPWFAQADYPIAFDPTVILENNGADAGLGYNITTGDFNGDNAMDIAIGTPDNDVNHDSYVGAVYVHYGGTSIDEIHDLLINAPANSVRFGAALGAGDLNNDGYDDLIVGDPGYSSDDGRAYLYWGSSSFDGTADLTFTAPDSGGKFGFAIATGDLNAPTDSYDDLVITAPAYSTDDGRAYVYHGNSTANMDTTNDSTLDPPSSGQDGLFGHSVAIGQFETSADSDEDVYIGEPWYGGSDVGRMYVFYGGTGYIFDTTEDITSDPDLGLGDGRFGYSIAVADYDNDGDDDAWVGAPYGDFGPTTNCGIVYRVNAGEGNGVYDADYRITTANLYLGISVAGGDIEGDGNEEGIAGGRGSASDEGIVAIFWQTTGGTTSWSGSNNGDRLGFALATGDVNDDGTYVDIIVGAPGYSSGNMDGAAFVYYGNTDGSFDTTSDIDIISPVNERFGFSLAKGDFNNDNYDDLAVGAPYLDGGDGAVYIYFGTASGLSDQQPPDVIYRSEYSGELFGWNITAGDFNGDGYDDLLAGAPSNDETSPDGGRAYIFYGGDGTDMDGDGVDIDIVSETSGEQFGWSVAAGNVEGTSNDDAVIGAPTSNTDEGRVYIYSDFTAPTESSPNASLYRGDSEEFGSSVATMNYDEDGYDDVLVGAPLNDSDGNTDKGVAFIYRGTQNMSSWFPVPGVGGNRSSWDHSVWDNCPSEDVFNLTSDDDVYYHVYGESTTRTMGLWQLSTTGLSGLITGAVLYVQYNTDPGYGTLEDIIVLRGSNWITSGITPSTHADDYNDSADLFALGFDTWSEISAIQILFNNTSTNKDVNFDYVAVNITTHQGEEANITLKGQYAGDFTGFSIASGDFDGDSSYADDAVLGAPGYYDATNDTGAVYIYSGLSIRNLGGDGTLSTTDKTIIGPGSTDAKFGWSVDSLDATGDAYDDLIVGAPYNGTADDDGAFYVYVGPTSNFNIPVHMRDGEENELFGYDVIGGEFITGYYTDDAVSGGPFFNATDNDGRVVIESIPEFEEILIPLILVIAIPLIIRRRLR